MTLRIGLIADTHGLLRREVVAFLKGSDHIVHGGDVCDPSVLRELASIAPLTTVRGNNDLGSWASQLRETEYVQLGQISLYAIHDLAQLTLDRSTVGVSVIVSGHSHKPCVERRDGVLYVNPGSAGPRRFKLPISAGELTISGHSVSARIVEFATIPR